MKRGPPPTRSPRCATLAPPLVPASTQHALQPLHSTPRVLRGRRPMRSPTALRRAAAARPWRMCSSSCPRSERSDAGRCAAQTSSGGCVCAVHHAVHACHAFAANYVYTMPPSFCLLLHTYSSSLRSLMQRVLPTQNTRIPCRYRFYCASSWKAREATTRLVRHGRCLNS